MVSSHTSPCRWFLKFKVFAKTAAILLITLQQFQATAQTPSPSREKFVDLENHIAAQEAIQRMVSQSIMRPVSPTRFAPDEPVTRGEFSISLQQMFNLPAADKTSHFSDIPTRGALAEAITAVEPFMGRQLLCFGCALGTNFLPNQAVSYTEVIFTLSRILIAQNKMRLPSPSDTDAVLAMVTDANVLSGPSRPYFAAAIKDGVADLQPAIEPGRVVTRVNLAVLLDKVQKKYSIPPTTRAP
jgi:hypothetical protein